MEGEREESEDDSSGIQSEWEGLDSVQSGPTTKLQVCVKRLKGRRGGGWVGGVGDGRRRRRSGFGGRWVEG